MGILNNHLDKIVQKIIEESHLSRRDILDRIAEKKEKLAGLVTDEAIVLMVAADLKVKIDTLREEQDEEILTIGDLVAGLNNVTITGRVTKVSPLREFNDRHNEKGTVADLVIADRAASIPLILWGGATQPIQEGKLNEGDIIRVHNAYVKENMGLLELNVGRLGRVELNPPDAKAADYPESSTTAMRIHQITPGMNEADILGTATGPIHTVRETKTKDGRTVKYASFTLKDATGATIRVVLWDEATTVADKIREGDTVEVNSGRVRPDRSGKLELHINTPVSVRVRQPPNSQTPSQ